jgi:hypothetical protein
LYNYVGYLTTVAVADVDDGRLRLPPTHPLSDFLSLPNPPSLPTLLRQNFKRPIYFSAEDFDVFTDGRALCADGKELG